MIVEPLEIKFVNKSEINNETIDSICKIKDYESGKFICIYKLKNGELKYVR